MIVISMSTSVNTLYGRQIDESEEDIFQQLLNNKLKRVYFPKWMQTGSGDNLSITNYDAAWTFGRRSPEGVSEGDACSADYGRLCDAVVKSGQNKEYNLQAIEGHHNCYVQIVDPEQTIGDRKSCMTDGALAQQRLTDLDMFILGGLPNLDGMKAQSPGIEFDYPYYLKDMVPARIPEKGRSIAWNYPESAEEEGIDLQEGYTWQDMVSGKDLKSQAWNWEALEIFPSGKKKSILRVDEIPKGGADLLHDAVMIYAGKGINPYNPEVYTIMVVGGRGGSSALGAMIVDRNPRLEKINGGIEFFRQLDYEIESRPSNSRGIKFVVDDWLESGQPKKIGGIQHLVYTQ